MSSYQNVVDTVGILFCQNKPALLIDFNCYHWRVLFIFNTVHLTILCQLCEGQCVLLHNYTVHPNNGMGWGVSSALEAYYFLVYLRCFRGD